MLDQVEIAFPHVDFDVAPSGSDQELRIEVADFKAAALHHPQETRLVPSIGETQE